LQKVFLVRDFDLEAEKSLFVSAERSDVNLVSLMRVHSSLFDQQACHSFGAIRQSNILDSKAIKGEGLGAD